MGKKSSSAPAAPDPSATAKAESQYNRLDTYSPSGSGVRYGYTDPTTGKFVQGVTPDGLDAQSAVKTKESAVERQLRKMLEPASVDLTSRIISDNITNLPDAARVQDRGTVAQDIFDRNFSLMAPAIDRANSRLISNLQARGLPVGGDAFNEAYGNQQAQTQDTISRLAQDANVAAGQEQSRQFALDSAARQGAISELVAAMGGGYNPPSNTPSGSAPSVNYSGLVEQNYANQVNAYNQAQSNKIGAASTVGSLGAMLLKCSVSTKAIISAVDNRRPAQIVQSIPLFVWRYNAEHAMGDLHAHLGPMAEQFHQMTGLGTPDTIHIADYLGVLIGALQNALQRIDRLEYQLNGGEEH